MRKKTGDRKSAWNAIVFTCLSKTSARTIQKELDIHQSKGFIGKDVLILTLEDPKGGVGSGGATLNALLVVTEHLSAKAGFRVVTESVLENARILIMHLGQNFPFSSCGRFFNQLPAKHTEESKENLCDAVVLNFDLVFHIISDTLSVNAPPGVWICSSDMIPSISPDQKINWEQLSGGFTVFLSQGDVKYAKDHGVAKLGENGDIKDIIFRESEDKIRSFALDNGMVPVVSGWVYMGSKVAFKVLSLHVYHPLDACSYYGLDNGAEPIQLSMIFDILLCMAEDVTESAFVEGDRSGTYGRGIQLETSRTTEQEAMLMRSARAQLWNKLRGCQLKGVFLENGTFDYMKVSAECYRRQITQSVESLHLSGMPSSSSNLTHVAFLKNGTLHDCDNHVSKSCVVVNSVLESGIKVGENSVITNCDLKGDVTIGPGSVFIGVSSDNMKSVPVGFTFPDDLCLMQFNVNLPKLSDKPQQVLVVMGVHDDLQVPFSSADSSYCNKPWRTFFNETGINPEEIWFGVPEDEQCLWNARLFSVVHFFDFANEKTCKDDLLWLAMVTYGSAGSSNGDSDVNRNFISDPERSQHQGLNSCLKRWRSSLRMSLKEIMSLLDLSAEFKLTKSLWFQIGKAQVEDTLRNCTSDCLLPFFRSCTQEGFAKDLLETLDQVASSTSSPGVAARTLACIADVLGAMAGESTGLRSGPARNESWMEAVKFLEKGDIQAGVKRLAEERKLWFDRPDLLIRAARHYEGAEQILRRQAVFTAEKFFEIEESEPLPMGHWVIAEAPARADLSGCWTDTPPITYEHGGAVLTVAINLNGKKVMGAKVRKIPTLEILLVIHSGEHSLRVACTELSHLENYTQPHAPGALLKACFCLLDIVTLPSSESLTEQLRKKYNAGFELHTWSVAPQGSGLGTSSILAGVILAALLRATGRKATLDSLVHAVLLIEQMLTTGGGWQDNAGGLVPGFKMTRSKASLPLKVEVESLQLSQETVDKFSERLICLYSGKPRLAKNLLQDVVRNWYARFPQITENADNLISNAEEAVLALKEGNIEKFGACMSCYRKQKSIMAPGTEPDSIHEVMEALDPLVLGQTLTGAGGGGFLVLITKEPNMADKVKAVIEEKKASERFAFYDVSVDWDGLTVRVETSSQ
ncbi:L-fucose kinase-like isoform X2 [Montipora foliosa]|uniref:L-fucose kinase-like isoform X2 n=1 Tax=Montipora foliosa TaxID=591990 RepID=UPI0035F1883B